MILYPGDLILFDLSDERERLGPDWNIGKGSLLILEDDINRAMYHGICSHTSSTSLSYLAIEILLHRGKATVIMENGSIRKGSLPHMRGE